MIHSYNEHGRCAHCDVRRGSVKAQGPCEAFPEREKPVERRNKHGELMCSCPLTANHGGKPCPNEATMNMAEPRYLSKRCTACELGRTCRE